MKGLFKSSDGIGFLVVPNILFLGYIFLVLIKVFYPDFPFVIFVFYSFSVFLTQLVYIVQFYKNLFFCISLFFLYGCFIVAVGDGTLLTPISLIGHLGLTVLIIRYQLSSFMIRIIIYLYGMYCTYQSVFLQANLNELAGGSRNLLGWIALGLAITYYTIKVRNRENIDILTSIIVLFIALVCVGRGNIIASIALFSIVLYHNFSGYRIAKKISYTALIVGGLSFFVITFSSFIEEKISYFENKGFESDERAMVLDAYLNKINLETLLVGVSSEQYPFTILRGNFHNSLLLGHSNFGILFILFFLFLFISFFYYWANSNTIFVKALLLILCVRAFTDTILFVGYFDFIYIYILSQLYGKKDVLYVV